jgi:hypothetical protein
LYESDEGTSIRIAGLLDKIRTWDLPNMLKFYAPLEEKDFNVSSDVESL